MVAAWVMAVAPGPCEGRIRKLDIFQIGAILDPSME
jgi:hypothetical protein